VNGGIALRFAVKGVERLKEYRPILGVIEQFGAIGICGHSEDAAAVPPSTVE
jgi:hypothetical protein